MRRYLTKLGDLSTVVVDDLAGDTKPRLAVILCHGFGAPGTDLVDVGGEMLALSDKLAATTRFYFPAGPLDLGDYGMFGARAWWMIDFEAIQRAQREGGFRQRLRDERPEGLAQARAQLLALVAAVRKDTGLGLDRFVLGGFSQGSMLTVDVAFQLEASPAALLAWSGTLLNEVEWRKLGPARKGLKVVQSHGRQDQILPFTWAEYLRETLSELGLQVEFLPFDGPHTISMQALQRSVALLETIA